MKDKLGEGHTMEKVTRRSFIGTMGMMGALAGAGALAGTSSSSAQAEVVDYADMDLPWSGSAATLDGCPWSGTPENILKIGGSTMPLEELNHRRQQYVDAQTEYVCADGTVIPEVYVKVYALVNTYSTGCGNLPNDATFSHMMELLTEEQAQAFLDMPKGVWFRALDLYEKGGRTLEECEQVCEELRAVGYLPASERPNGTFYHQPALGGLGGYLMNDEQYAKSKEGNGNFSCLPMGDTYFHDFTNSGTPYYYPVPCDKSVVDTGEVLACDDVWALLKSHKNFAVAPCACRYFELVAQSDDYPTLEDFATGEYVDYTVNINDKDFLMETCLFTGEEAQYWVELGVARAIDREEAEWFLKRNVETGHVIEPYFAKDSACICSCVSDFCAGLGSWLGVYAEQDINEGANAFQQVSHYNLVVDLDSCIKCGACAARCPMYAIEMNGEDGAPQINGLCVRCGQCAYVCPQQARKLTLRPEEERLPMPETLSDDWNLKAAYRFERGFIY